MREIEFRGKRKDNGKWMYGSPVYLDPEHIGMWTKNAQSYFWVTPQTVGQYTGLKDKNGAKIFEGDILEWGHYKWICQVSWLEDTARFLYITVDRRLIYPGEARACEIIGNVHDNPELLEVGK